MGVIFVSFIRSSSNCRDLAVSNRCKVNTIFLLSALTLQRLETAPSRRIAAK
jgi:hypothetical protein